MFRAIIKFLDIHFPLLAFRLQMKFPSLVKSLRCQSMGKNNQVKKTFMWQISPHNMRGCLELHGKYWAFKGQPLWKHLYCKVFTFINRFIGWRAA